jgi:hypothetical protein
MCPRSAADTQQLWSVKSKTRQDRKKMSYHEAKAPLCEHQTRKMILKSLLLVNGVWFLSTLKRPSLPIASTTTDQRPPQMLLHLNKAGGMASDA